MPMPVLTVDQVLTMAEGNLSAADLRPYFLSMVFANAAARASRKAVTDPVAAGQTFSQQWSQRLGQVGWVITSAGTSRISTSGTGQTATVADQLTQVSGNSPGLAAALGLVKAAGDDAGPVTSLWWPAVTEGPMMQGALGQVAKGADGLTFALASFTLDGSKLLLPSEGFFHRHPGPPDLTTPQVLFETVQAGSIDLTVSTMTAVLQGNVFAGQASELERLVAAKMAEHIAADPASLAAGGQP